MLRRIVMCVFVGTLLGALAAGAEVVATEAHRAMEAPDLDGGLAVSVSAARSSSFPPSDP